MSRPLHLALRQIPPAQRAYNRDRSRVLGWYVARHDEDRYDETTEYRIGVFNAAEEELTFLVTSVHERADTGVKEGQPLVSAAFDPADEDTLILRFADKSEERRRVDEAFNVLKPSKDLGLRVSDAEKRVLERLRQQAEKLKKP
jgi:hypothetical protein